MKKALAWILAVLTMMTFASGAWAEEMQGEEWCLARAEELKDKLYEMISFEGFAEYFTPQDEVISLLDGWKAVMEAEPASVTAYDLPSIELISEFTPEMEKIPIALLEKIERSMAATLMTQMNGMEGVNFLSASSIAALGEGYIMPEGFRPRIVLYEYEGICIGVGFSQTGEGVVGATVQFASPRLLEMLTAG